MLGRLACIAIVLGFWTAPTAWAQDDLGDEAVFELADEAPVDEEPSDESFESASEEAGSDAEEDDFSDLVEDDAPATEAEDAGEDFAEDDAFVEADDAGDAGELADSMDESGAAEIETEAPAAAPATAPPPTLVAPPQPSPATTAPAAGMRLYVGTISFETNDDDLRALFAQFGTVVSSRIVRDLETGRSKGYGFVEMATLQETREALKQLNRKVINDREMTVMLAR